MTTPPAHPAQPAPPTAAEPPTRPARAARPRGPRGSWTPAQIALTLVAAALSLVWLAPLAWALSTSLKSPTESVSAPHWIPRDLTPESWKAVIRAGDIPNWFVNSVVVSVCVTFVVLVVSALAGYGFARTEFRGKPALLALTMAGLMFSPAILGVPLFTTVRSLGMVDTYWGMILPQCAPAAMVYILYKFFQSLPKELEEAAFVDGAGRWRIFLTIVLPLSKPSLSAVGIFTFIASWNNFLWPYMVTNNPDLMTMPNGIATVQNAFGIVWPQLMAGGLLAGLPLIVVFVFFQSQIVRGVAHTGLAGQ